MPPINFKFEVEGKTQFNRSFSRADLVISDLRPVWDEIRNEFFDIQREQFKSEGGAGSSGQWKPLSTKYARLKNKKYPGKTILRRTDKLFKSLTSNTSDSIYIPKKDEVAMGTSVKYAKYHHNGSGRLPQREVISFSNRQRNRLTKKIQAKLISEMRKTGFKTE